MSIRYKIKLGVVEKDFPTEIMANTFKAENPEWKDAEVVPYEVPTPVVEKEVPQSVPLWCLRTVLRAMGLLDHVKQTIAAMPDGTLKIAAEEGLEYANTVLRESPTTVFIQQVLKLSDEQVDDIFINADKVEA